MSGLSAGIVWQDAHGTRVDPRVLALLAALQRHATLKAAADEVRLSYRAAWGLLMDAGERAGAPLVEMQRGRGARLTRLGAELVRNDEGLKRALQPLRERFAVHAAGTSTPMPMRMAASHDPLLAQFCERFAVPAGLIGDVSFRGSEDCLALFSRGAVEIAGFHLDDVDLRRYVRSGRDSLIRFAEREQGLIVAHGNPKSLATLRDVAHRHARFVNRQRGSGTRRHIDRLLAEAGIRPDAVRGYSTEEHTHLAVAATVATGRADVGFGVHAAAAQFDLDFVPVLREQYWLAVRTATLSAATGEQLLDALGGKPLARLARRLPGYDLRQAGSVAGTEQASR